MSVKKEKNQKKNVTVRITAQQRPLLNRAIADGGMGKSAQEVIRQVFLKWANAKLEKGGNKNG